MSQETPWFENKRVEITDLHRDDLEQLRPLVGIGLVAALAMILSLLGCTRADVPLCERYQAELVTGLASGTCRIEAPKPEGKQV